MIQFERRIQKLEAASDCRVTTPVRLVFSDEEAAAARSEIGEKGIVVRVVGFVPGKEVV